MGNYKFRFADMLPNAWFYKLKDMTKIRTHHYNRPKYASSAPSHLSKITVQPHLSDHRQSYYITRDLTNFHPKAPTNSKMSDKEFPIRSPRKSLSRRRRSTKRRRSNRVSVSASCSCRTALQSIWSNSPNSDQAPSSDNESMLTAFGSPGESPETFDSTLSGSTTCQCSTQNDVVMDIDNKATEFAKQFSEFSNLPHIITKNKQAEFSDKDSISRTKKRLSTNSSSPGVKLRTNSPKIGNSWRIQGGRKSVSSGLGRESFAVVKSSVDPGRDFRESMVEMIVENKISSSKDLEELLACYLLLNSDEYHGIIINVFKKIWFDFFRVRLK